MDRRRDQPFFRTVEIIHIGAKAAFIEHFSALLVGMTLVAQYDFRTRVQERQFAQAMLQRGVVELDLGEGFRARQERHAGTALVRHGWPHNLQRCLGIAVAETDEVLLAIAPNGEIEPSRERVDNGNADAVQTTRHLVRIALLALLVELSAGVELGHDDLGCGFTFTFVHAGRDSAAIIGHGARPIGVEHDFARGCIASHDLVDRVVDDFVDHVVQARAIIGVADVHARALTNRIEAF